jgi:glycine cleavage system aminomethyltransferase T
LAVQGPLAEDAIARLLGEWVRKIPFFRYRPAELDGIPLWVGRAGWSKQGGFELYLCDHTRGTELWDLVANAGAAVGIGPGAPNYIERVEGALLSYRADTDFDTDPFELGMERWVDLDTDFIGRDALVARRTTGPRRRLVGMFLDGSPLQPNAHPWLARVGDTVAGWVKAVAHSPRLNRNIAIALMTTPHDKPGTEVTVTTEKSDVRDGQMTTLPFLAGSLRSG